MLSTLAINGVELEYTQKELYEVILRVTSSEATFEELLAWVLNHEIK
jgi:death-on-curing protein